jgi:hypothetical protein
LCVALQTAREGHHTGAALSCSDEQASEAATTGCAAASQLPEIGG